VPARAVALAVAGDVAALQNGVSPGATHIINEGGTAAEPPTAEHLTATTSYRSF